MVDLFKLSGPRAEMNYPLSTFTPRSEFEREREIRLIELRERQIRLSISRLVCFY